VSPELNLMDVCQGAHVNLDQHEITTRFEP
jgi:hypothetical protein